METIKKLEMLKSLATYLSTNNKSVKIIKTDNSIIIGKVKDIEKDIKKGIAAELFIDPKSGNISDSPEIIINLTLVDINDSQIEINFREIANFEPIVEKSKKTS